MTIASSTYGRGIESAATAGTRTIAAIIEANDTMREVATVMPNAASGNSSAIGASTAQMPRDADNPLPPLNPRNTDAIDPANAASATHASVPGGSPSIRATATGTAPFNTSPKKVSAAALAPPARATLVMPILPEPTARGSKPRSFPTITPKGIEPIRYERAINVPNVIWISGVSREAGRWSG